MKRKQKRKRKEKSKWGEGRGGEEREREGRGGCVWWTRIRQRLPLLILPLIIHPPLWQATGQVVTRGVNCVGYFKHVLSAQQLSWIAFDIQSPNPIKNIYSPMFDVRVKHGRWGIIPLRYSMHLIMDYYVLLRNREVCCTCRVKNLTSLLWFWMKSSTVGSLACLVSLYLRNTVLPPIPLRLADCCGSWREGTRELPKKGNKFPEAGRPSRGGGTHCRQQGCRDGARRPTVPRDRGCCPCSLSADGRVTVSRATHQASKAHLTNKRILRHLGGGLTARVWARTLDVGWPLPHPITSSIPTLPTLPKSSHPLLLWVYFNNQGSAEKTHTHTPNPQPQGPKSTDSLGDGVG